GHLQHRGLQVNDRLRAVAHRPRRLGGELQEPQQVALAPALALRLEPRQVLLGERHQVAARRIHLEDQHVPDVLGQAVGEGARGPCASAGCRARSGAAGARAGTPPARAKNASRSAMPSTRRTNPSFPSGSPAETTWSSALTASRTEPSDLCAMRSAAPSVSLKRTPSLSFASRAAMSSSRSATLRNGTRAKSKRWQRERIVSG